MRFTPLERSSHPWGYRINLVASWPAAGFFTYAPVLMPKRRRQATRSGRHASNGIV